MLFLGLKHKSVRLFSVVLSHPHGRFCGRSRLFSVVLGYFRSFKSFFRSFFTSDSLDKIVMTFCLKSYLFISSATSHPILRWSHHCSRHGDAPAPPMIIVFILVMSPVRARRATSPLTAFLPVPFRLRNIDNTFTLKITLFDW